MLLPQGAAFATLHERLRAATSLHRALSGAGAGASSGAGASASASASASSAWRATFNEDVAFAAFAATQAEARRAWTDGIRARSLLLNAPAGGTAALAAPASAALALALAPAALASGGPDLARLDEVDADGSGDARAP